MQSDQPINSPPFRLPPYYGIRTVDVLNLGQNQNWEILSGIPFATGLGNRISILGANGRINLTIPVKKHRKHTSFFEIEIDHLQKWQNQHWRSIISAYGKSPYFHYFREELEQIFNRNTPLLCDFTLPVLGWVHRQIFPKGGFSVNLSFDPNEKSDFLLLHPLSLEDKAMVASEPPYHQVFGDKFVSGLSILDALFCEGPGYIKFKTGLRD